MGGLGVLLFNTKYVRSDCLFKCTYTTDFRTLLNIIALYCTGWIGDMLMIAEHMTRDSRKSNLRQCDRTRRPSWKLTLNLNFPQIIRGRHYRALGACFLRVLWKWKINKQTRELDLVSCLANKLSFSTKCFQCSPLHVTYRNGYPTFITVDVPANGRNDG